MNHWSLYRNAPHKKEEAEFFRGIKKVKDKLSASKFNSSENTTIQGQLKDKRSKKEEEITSVYYYDKKHTLRLTEVAITSF